MKSVELFAGAGGLSIGLEKAGWKSQLLIEKNHHACCSLRLNQQSGHMLARNWNILEEDVRQVDYSKICSKIDLVAGGPPCQPFSLGGKHNASSDNRDMFPEAIRAVRDLSPKFFLFENVKGLLRKSFADYFRYIIIRLKYPFEGQRKNESWENHYSRLTQLDSHRLAYGSKQVYNVKFNLLNAADYGVPQHRHRVIIVGVREDLGWSFKFPNATHCAEELLVSKYLTKEYWTNNNIDIEQDISTYKTLAVRVEKLKSKKAKLPIAPPLKSAHRTVYEALKDLPTPALAGVEGYFNHELRKGARPYSGHTGSPLHFPSKAIKAGAHGVPGGENMIAYPNGLYRYYSTREAARIQTFPDDYVFTGSWTECMRQIGNAVPSNLAYQLGAALYQQAKKHYYATAEQRSLQSA